jgi:hypothetical protein
MRWTLVSILGLMAACLLCRAWFAVPQSPHIEMVEEPDNLGSVPPDNPKLYERIQIAEDWKNPFIQIHGALVSSQAHGTQTKVPVGEVVSVLRALPVSAWPYGNVVAVEAGSGPQTPEAAQAIEQTRVQLDVLLKVNDMAIDYWP